jgi:hypothetical protein
MGGGTPPWLQPLRVFRNPPQRAVPARNAHPDSSGALTRTNMEAKPR